MRGRQREGSRARVLPSRPLAVGLCTIVGIALLLTLFISRELQIKGRRRHLDALTAAQAAASEEQIDLRDRLAAGDDPSVIEDVARERLGLVMPGEEKVIFIRETAP